MVVAATAPSPELPPCAADPEAWFAARSGVTTDNAEERRTCLTECTLSRHRRCAAAALKVGSKWGVWAAVRLPGQQLQFVQELGEARESLRLIADGVITAADLPENAELLEGDADATHQIAD